jgi:hypothetical protein
MDKITLQMPGGSHIYDPKTKTYTLSRKCGLFSNISVAIYAIVKLHTLGHKVDYLELYLQEYETDHNFYPDLFKTSAEPLDLDKCSNSEINDFMALCIPTTIGLGFALDDIKYSITDKVVKKFFQLSERCRRLLYYTIAGHNIVLDNAVFLWARKTDKQIENHLPTPERYINILTAKNLIKKDIILQTDDFEILDEFRKKYKSYKNIRTLDILPYSMDVGFHINMFEIPWQDFTRLNGMTKTEHLQKLVSLAALACNCKNSMIYPGNLSTIIPILKGNANGVITFNQQGEQMIGEIKEALH